MVRTFNHGGQDLTISQICFLEKCRKIGPFCKIWLILECKVPYSIEYFDQFLALLFFRQRLRSTKKPCNYLKTRSRGRKRRIKRRETNRGQLRRKNATVQGRESSVKELFLAAQSFPGHSSTTRLYPQQCPANAIDFKITGFQRWSP